MILQLLMTSLLITPGIGGYNLAYKQNDSLSTNNFNYEIEQEVYITDNDNLYISFTIWNDDNEWFKVESERPLNEYMPWLDDDNIDRFPKELYQLPVAWFGIDQGNALFEYDLTIDLSPSENTLASLYVMPLNNGNFDFIIDYIYSFGISFDYVINYLLNYYANYLDNTGYTEYDPGVYINLYQGNYWEYSYSSVEIPSFGDLVIDLSVTYGHIQTLYDMKYGDNGLSNQINQLIGNVYVDAYGEGYDDGLNDGYNIRNDLYLPFKNAIIVGAYRNENGEITFVDRYNLELVNGIYDFSSVVDDIEDIANDVPDYNSSEDAYIRLELESGVRASDITFDIIGFEDLVITYSDGVNKYYNDLFPLNYTSIQDDSNKFISSIELTFNLYDNLQDYKLGIQVKNDYANGFDNGFSEGQQAVIKNPNDYGLFDENQYEDHYKNGYNNGKLDAEVPVGLNWVKAAINVFFGFLGFMILPGVTLGDIFSGLIILLILKWVLGWFRG